VEQKAGVSFEWLIAQTSLQVVGKCKNVIVEQQWLWFSGSN